MDWRRTSLFTVSFWFLVSRHVTETQSRMRIHVRSRTEREDREDSVEYPPVVYHSS